jgi:hypothetical protein
VQILQIYTAYKSIIVEEGIMATDSSKIGQEPTKLVINYEHTIYDEKNVCALQNGALRWKVFVMSYHFDPCGNTSSTAVQSELDLEKRGFKYMIARLLKRRF